MLKAEISTKSVESYYGTLGLREICLNSEAPYSVIHTLLLHSTLFMSELKAKPLN
jgi:hypothetical protein